MAGFATGSTATNRATSPRANAKADFVEIVCAFAAGDSTYGSGGGLHLGMRPIRAEPGLLERTFLFSANHARPSVLCPLSPETVFAFSANAAREKR